MIDLHCHILPGIDDGAKNIGQSLAMARQAAEHGTTVMVATPHMQPGVYNNSYSQIEQAAGELRQALRVSSIDIELRWAAEVHLCPEVILWAQRDELPFIGEYQGKRVLLLELPHASIPQGTSKLINWLLHHNILPMIAHPERNRAIWKDAYHLQQLKQLGCLFQITADSLMGNFREQAQRIAEDMVKSGLAQVIASDAHGQERRSPNLLPAFNKTCALANKKRAQELLLYFPQTIIA